MWLDALALLVLGFFIGRGAFRGGLATGLGLLVLVGSYGAAFLAAPRLGPGLARELGIPELLGVPLAGTIAFAVVSVGAGIASALAKRLRPFGRNRRSPRDRFFGGVFGAIRGGLVVLLLSWLAIWVDALRSTGVVASLPEIGPSVAATLTESAVEGGVRAAFSDAGPPGRLAASVAARPGRAIIGIQRVLDSPRLGALREDRMFWAQVEHGSIDAALDRASFVELAFDAEIRSEFVELGLVERSSRDDPGAFLDAAGDVMRDVGPRIRGVRSDPEFQKLIADQEIIAMVRDGDTLGLLAHNGFRGFVTRLATQEAGGPLQAAR